MSTIPEGYHEHGWGYEFVFANNEKYCGKILKFNAGSKFSMHFHAEKDETWYVLDGKFIVRYIDTDNAVEREQNLGPNDVWRNLPMFPHQIQCIEEGVIVEVSTTDDAQDIYRISKGDSQL